MVLNSHEDNFSVATNGWTCGICNQWMNAWETHFCSGYPSYPSYPVYPNPWSYPPPNQTIEERLTEIENQLGELLR